MLLSENTLIFEIYLNNTHKFCVINLSFFFSLFSFSFFFPFFDMLMLKVKIHNNIKYLAANQGWGCWSKSIFLAYIYELLG